MLNKFAKGITRKNSRDFIQKRANGLELKVVDFHFFLFLFKYIMINKTNLVSMEVKQITKIFETSGPIYNSITSSGAIEVEPIFESCKNYSCLIHLKEE